MALNLLYLKRGLKRFSSFKKRRTQMKVLGSLLFSVLLSGATVYADTPSIHGMVVFGGEKDTYASHLPMFHSPHDRQVILKIALNNLPGSKALEKYTAAKSSGK